MKAKRPYCRVMMVNSTPPASQRFFANRECAFYPCHAGADPAAFNCLFCFCPLYAMKDCGGNPGFTAKGVKDCSGCLFPHDPAHYDDVIAALSRAARAGGEPAQAGETGPALDVDGLLARLEHNKPFVVQLLGVFLDDCPKKLAALAEAVEQDDQELAGRLVHSIKGTAMTIEAGPLLESASRAESRIKAGQDVRDLLPGLMRTAHRTIGEATCARAALAAPPP